MTHAHENRYVIHPLTLIWVDFLGVCFELGGGVILNSH